MGHQPRRTSKLSRPSTPLPRTLSSRRTMSTSASRPRRLSSSMTRPRSRRRAAADRTDSHPVLVMCVALSLDPFHPCSRLLLALDPCHPCHLLPPHLHHHLPIHPCHLFTLQYTPVLLPI